ncbi:MAG: hypothetical protein DWQ07_19740 [Chloroflexi bacterium]|nr:MAG: hypothetical protein DWQ07_19740 [Chloroflexota bacterium]MBL1194316.1 hypothetical protein [Chloroflexota bacterium]
MLWIVVGVVLIIGCCLAGLVMVGAGAIFGIQTASQSLPVSSDPTSTPIVIRPDEEPTQSSSDGVTIEVSSETLDTLTNTLVPINDPVDLAQRLEGKTDIPLTVPAPPGGEYQLGAERQFWITDTDTNISSQIPATLRYKTEHLYFWIENSVDYDEGDLEALAENFENETYPLTREFFGSEWSPGVDNDPHIYILYSGGLGFSVAGYFSSSDAYHPLASENSNAAEMFVINADNTFLNQEFTYGVLAHEFQHMIHWNLDRNETSWLNEGFSELAQLLNGYAPFSDYSYVSNPDHQLNDWPNDGDTGPYYGGGFLFTAYFLERFGNEATQALVAHPDNGLTSVDAVLQDIGATDEITGEQISASDLVLDWGLTNYLQDPEVGDGRYAYDTVYPDAPQVFETETINQCGGDFETRDVHQHGFDYIRITCDGEYTLRFEGSLEVDLLPRSAYSGSYAFWSNKGDHSDMTLTRSFDFTDVEDSLTFSFRTWYDIETDWDYAYLLASTDGETWDFLTTDLSTDYDPTGNSYGWGYTGVTNGWVSQSVDLSAYAGQEVQLRFEYITDAAVNGEGMLIDDISISEIDYFEDFEAGDGGWESAGFVRIQNQLPQSFRLAVISKGPGVGTAIEYIDVDASNVAEIALSIGGDVDEVILVVMGNTRFTRQTAAYRFEITQ